jgi:hypothetical protein
MAKFGFDAGEMRILKTLKTPEKIQRFLDTDIAYNKEPDGDTIRSPRRVLRDRVAHCLEGALLAAAALRVQGFPPLLLDFEAVRDDDHVLAVFKQHGHWGAIAKSNYSGLRSAGCDFGSRYTGTCGNSQCRISSTTSIFRKRRLSETIRAR